jgi:hypothetical protein
MGSLSGNDFRKKWHCPSSQVLVSYHQRDLSDWQMSQVVFHLATCDFCAAELQLLSKFPLAEHCKESPAMPANLRALAEALLKKSDLRRRDLLAMTQDNRQG